MGSIYKRGNVWWVKYYRNGVPMRESSESDKETVAKNLLKAREGDIIRGVPVTPQTNRVTLAELLDDVLTDYRVNGRRSLDTITYYIDGHVRPFFGTRKAASVTTADVRQYVAERQAAGAANATINRELATLTRAYSLGLEAGSVTHKPAIKSLKEDNARKGFFEREQFEAVRAKLPEPLRPVVTFLYITGWRVDSEVVPLQWRQVDFEGGTVRLDPGTTKNGEARVFPMTADLRALLEAQRVYTDAVQKQAGAIIPDVFHRDGEPIRTFRRSWKSACKAAGCPDRLRHDFRRTAVRNLVRAGIPERVAMQMTGHKTRAVFERYNIVSEGDLTDAARKLDAFAGTIAGTITRKNNCGRPVGRPQVLDFASGADGS
ncbi:MAG TPA: site-specific integrase [Candidatus Dormibacteraeota bacterium]|nr:site-specific integrase [Candidatus Dormibacteraeota bacterium]